MESKRKAYGIEVSRSGGRDIRIQWDDPKDDCFILVTAEQAEQVCGWIMDLSREIQEEQLASKSHPTAQQ